MRLRSAVRFSALLFIAGLGACTEEGYKITDLSDELVVSPLFAGSAETDAGFPTVSFSALVGGSPVPVTWASSDLSVATVSPAGLATPVGAGFTAITATQGTRIKSASLSVTAFPGVRIFPGTPVSIAGATDDLLQYRVVVPPGTTNLRIEMSGGTGDFDIYVVQGEDIVGATFDNAEYFSFNGGNGELIDVANPDAGRWYILVHAWEGGAGANLLVTLTP